MWATSGIQGGVFAKGSVILQRTKSIGGLDSEKLRQKRRIRLFGSMGWSSELTEIKDEG